MTEGICSSSHISIEHPLCSKFIEEIRGDSDILALYQFGSSVSQEQYRDIDLCIITNQIESADFLPRFFRYSGVYAAYGKVPLDISLFSMLPLYIRIEVVSMGKVLYVQDRNTLFDCIMKTLREWDDYEQSYRILIS